MRNRWNEAAHHLTDIRMQSPRGDDERQRDHTEQADAIFNHAEIAKPQDEPRHQPHRQDPPLETDAGQHLDRYGDTAQLRGQQQRVDDELRAERNDLEGKAESLEVLRPFVDGSGRTPPNQEEAAEKLGVPVATLRTWLWRLRQRYREALRMEVASTVSDPDDVDQELHYLYQILTT